MIFIAKDEIIEGGMVQNLIAFVFFLGAIGCFALNDKMAEILDLRNKK